jgi:hypothetical protein
MEETQIKKPRSTNKRHMRAKLIFNPEASTKSASLASQHWLQI